MTAGRAQNTPTELDDAGMRGVEEQVHRLALTDAGLRRVAVGVHAEELLVGSFGDIAGETADDYVVK